MRPFLAFVALSTNLAAAEYRLKASPETIVWGYYSAGAKPVLHIKSGDTVTIDTLITSSPDRLSAAGVKPDQIEPELRAVYDTVKDKGPGGHILTGPIYIEGASPGDTLEVRILKISPKIAYAYNGYSPGRGFLPDEYPKARTVIIPFDLNRGIARFAPGIEISMKPFFGSMGLAPLPSAGRISSAPPGTHAGNLDNKELVAGTTLYIPVRAPGGLFEVGDGHAGQGNGEVDITALETSLTGTFQFVVRGDMHLEWPRAETATHFIVMGIDEDLTAAMKTAVHESIDFLMTQKHLSREDAYMLSSIAVDFVITQVVDGTKGVHGMIPKSIFK
jgi:acetamidase/formamidase